jgi:hypothetical protein
MLLIPYDIVIARTLANSAIDWRMYIIASTLLSIICLTSSASTSVSVTPHVEYLGIPGRTPTRIRNHDPSLTIRAKEFHMIDCLNSLWSRLSSTMYLLSRLLVQRIAVFRQKQGYVKDNNMMRIMDWQNVFSISHRGLALVSVDGKKTAVLWVTGNNPGTELHVMISRIMAIVITGILLKHAGSYIAVLSNVMEDKKSGEGVLFVSCQLGHR